MLDPHGACGYRALEEGLKEGEVGVFLETAHPAKFLETVESIIGEKVEIPAKLQEFMKGTKQSIEMGDEVEEIEHFEVLLNKNDRESFGSAVVEGARRVAERRIGAANAAKLMLAADTANIDGGLVLRLGNVELNCSLAVVMADLRAELEDRVAELLFHSEAEAEN